jgi:replication factor C subunit 3/5
MNAYCPFVEKHRPTKFEDIVLDPLNKKILENIIETSYFPNLLLYGPPGTGKTTTIINLVDAYQTKLGKKNKDLMIHLNASDERGIDIIRNQINLFVSSKPLFNTGMKFVILDEIDYMTKNAQQALRYLLQNYSTGVRFCLICNYISRIDDGLQNEFLKLRFNQLPQDDIVGFLKKIATTEKLNISDESLICIKKLYKSDIRSMVNFMQSNQDVLDEAMFKIIDEERWSTLFNKINAQDPVDSIAKYVNETSMIYNVDKKNIIKDFLNYIIRNKKHVVTQRLLSFVENVMHFQECKIDYFVNYTLIKLLELTNSGLEENADILV